MNHLITHPAHAAEHGFASCRGSAQSERSRELLVHGPGIAATIRRRWPRPLQAPRPAHADQALNLGSHAINASLGRLVVLTIRRLVASNPTCFASVRASHHRSTSNGRWLDAWTIPLNASLSRLSRRIQGLSRRMLNHVFSQQHSVACPRHRGECADPRGHLCPACRRQQVGNRIGLVVADLEHDPTVWEPRSESSAPSGDRAPRPSAPPSSAACGSKLRTSGSRSAMSAVRM